ncbi:hypothetical protein ABZ461_04145 [Actinacidiphila glaucinigra]|uniref:hypothetical protein n=1 Tax=Actinacidiphila glaucinigra TaxID=235986 RepID=UPI00340122AC
MDPDAPWRNLGFVGLRLGDLVVRYAATYALSWVVADLHLPGEGESLCAPCIPLIAIPPLLISAYYALLNPRTSLAFRLPPAGLLLLPTGFLLFQNFEEQLVIPVSGQLAFALWVIRVPLPGPARRRRGERVQPPLDRLP